MDLISMLQKALLQHHVSLEPVAVSTEPAYDFSQDPAVRYVSSFLLAEDGEDEMNVSDNHPGFRNLVTELSQIIDDSPVDSPVDSPDTGTSSESSDFLQDRSPRSVEDIDSLLVECAQAVAADEKSKVQNIVDIFQRMTYERESNTKLKVAFLFLEALLARLSGSGLPAHRAMKAMNANQYTGIFSNVPALRCSHCFSTGAILEKCKGAKRVHIIDYGIDRGEQWPSLIEAFAHRPEGPPYLNITGIEFSRLNNLLTGPKLKEYAKAYGVHLLYESIVSNNWETVNPGIRVDPDEVLVVNCNLRMRHLQEDGITTSNPRTLLLEKIHRMKPAIFVQCEMIADLCGPFFIPRFQEALRYYTGSMEMAFSSANFPEHLKSIFENMTASKIMNVVACEGLDRYERSMYYDKWDRKARRAGFKQVPLSEKVYNGLACFLGQFQYSHKLGMAQDKEWLIIGWDNSPLYAMCCWEPQ